MIWDRNECSYIDVEKGKKNYYRLEILESKQGSKEADGNNRLSGYITTIGQTGKLKGKVILVTCISIDGSC